MQKNLFIVQTILYYIFATLSVFALIYALGFMTDFKILFQQYGGLGEFHEEVLQPFNREIFLSALFMIIGFVILSAFNIRNRVADLTALILVILLCSYNIIVSFKFVSNLYILIEQYQELDFSQLLLPSNMEYFETTRTFVLGILFYKVYAVVNILIMFSVITNTVLYFYKKGGIKR